MALRERRAASKGRRAARGCRGHAALRAARPSRQRTGHDRRTTARGTAVAAARGKAIPATARSTTVAALHPAGDTAVSQPHATQPSQPRTRHNSRTTAHGTTIAARPSRHRTQHDRHRTARVTATALASTAFHQPCLHTATTALSSTRPSPPLHRCHLCRHHHQPPHEEHLTIMQGDASMPGWASRCIPLSGETSRLVENGKPTKWTPPHRSSLTAR